MNDLRWRLIQGSSANAVSLLARLAEQLLLVPIMLSAWSAHLYGEWLLVAAIPTYFMLSDLGFVSSGSNELARRASLDDEAGLRRFFTDYTSSFLRWSIAAFALIVAIAWFAPFDRWLGLAQMSERDSNLVFTLLIADALVTMNGLALLAGLRARRLFHIGLLLRALSSILILVGMTVAIKFYHAGPVFAAALQLGVRLIEFAAHLVILARRGLHVSYSPFHHNREPMKPFVVTGLQFMLFPLGEAVLLQGVIILLGIFATPALVAVFATHRTLTRITSQLLQLAVNPVRAEAGLLQGEEHRAELAGILVSASRITLWASFAFAIGLLLLGGWIFRIWTHDNLEFHHVLLSVLILATVVEGVWRVTSAVRLGTNRHQPLALGFLASSLLGLLCAGLLTSTLGMVGMAWGMVVAHLAMCLVTIPLTVPLIGWSTGGYLAAMLVPPVKEVQAGLRLVRRLLSRSEAA